MKKTLVAIAAAAAVTGAFAEVTISGFIDTGLNTTSVTDSTGSKTTINTVGSNLIGQDQLTFGVTEDLGDGMTAYGNVVFQTFTSGYFNNGHAATTAIVQDVGSGAGIKGAFGNVFIGYAWDQVWLTMNAADASGWGLGGGWAGSAWVNRNIIGANSQAVVYTLPVMVQGLDITIDHASGASATVTNGTGDSNGLGIAYTTGPLFLRYATKKQTVTSSTFTSYDAGISDQAATAVYDGTNATAQAFAATYDFGAAKLYAGSQTLAVDGGSLIAESKSTYGIVVPFGAASFAWAHSNAKTTDTAGTETSLTGDKVVLKYTLSKRTAVYAATGKSSTSGSSAGLTNTALGLTHSF